jgi:peptide/nickel transport system substrate-binding protein
MLMVIALVGVGALIQHHANRARHEREPRDGGASLKTIIIAQSNDADTLDPSDVGQADTLNVAKMMFGTLYDVSAEGKLEPYLAESYQYSEDGKSITFKLKPGLKCEDGEPLTAKDVAYSFDRANNPALKLTGNASGFILPSLGYRGSHVDDTLTVTLMVEKYNPIALGLISEMLIMCKKPYERMAEDQASTHPVATGPYRLAEWAHDDRIVLERNKNFTLKAPPYDRVIWRVIPEGSTRSAELIAGNVDIITNVPADQIEAINASDTAKIETISSTRRIYVGFNQSRRFASTPGGKAIQNPAVRAALQYAVDVPTICEALLRTPCQRAATLVVPQNDHSGIPATPYDPDLAEKMLDAAGYPKGPDGTRFTLTLQAPRNLYGNGTVAQAIGQYLSDIGVKTDVDIVDMSVYVPLTRKHEAGPLFLLGTGGSTWSALYDMSDLSAPDAGTNYTSWSYPEFFEGWKQLEGVRDEAGQTPIMNRMLHIFHDRSPWLMLYFQPDVYGVSNKIKWQPRADEMITLR